MALSVSATKGNLMSAKKSLGLAKTGYELMDRKRNILIREMMSLIDKAETLQNSIDMTFKNAYSSLQIANITLGLAYVSDVAQSIPIEEGIKIRFKSIMGVEVPVVNLDNNPPVLHYDMTSTNRKLDEAYINFTRLKQFIRILAEVENSIYKLASAIKKTQKRANALNNIIIPDYENTIKEISNALEEKDREDFSRLKVMKKS